MNVAMVLYLKYDFVVNIRFADISLIGIAMFAEGNFFTTSNVTETLTVVSSNYAPKNITEPETVTQFPTEKSTFTYYVNGLYGSNCTMRIVVYVLANNVPFSLPDLNCACYGECVPPLAPNPAAAFWFQSQLAVISSTMVSNYIQQDIVLIIITGVIVLCGTIGKFYYIK